MEHSIRTRLILILTVLLLTTIMLFWFVNRFFLADYYEKTKITTMSKVFQQVDNIYQSDTNESTISENIDVNYLLERLGANNGVDLSVIEFYDLGEGEKAIRYKFSLMNGAQQMLLKERFEAYIWATVNQAIIDENLLAAGERYQIYKVYDERIGSEYLECLGKLKNDYWIFMRSNYQSMKESAEIANRFLGYIGILVTVVGIIVMFFVGRGFTKPILRLYDIAERMADLDFNVKYQDVRNDEIGVLGNSMNALSEKLEGTISELKSANNELQSDIERKTQIDEMRQDFLSNVSHELKTPIALIQGYAEGLQENINEDSESREFYCDVIIDEANKMNRMVKRLLSLNQLEFGTNQIQFDRFDIVEVVRAVLSSTEILFRQKEVTLIFAEYEPIYVWADEYMVEEVVTNYISNALNHVQEPKRIEVKLKCRNEVVNISVFNTGIPIPEEELEKIWIKFYKIDKARTREYGGNGIGLSIVKAIMASLNRECGVRNCKNGVEFWFELDVKNE